MTEADAPDDDAAFASPGSPEERRRLLLRTLRAEGRLVAAELARVLRVSEDTIRRDLRDLAAAGLVQRVHGGALPPSPGLDGFAARARRTSSATSAVAAAAARLLRDRQVVTIDGGTTPLAVARQLPSDLRATVVTPSPPVAAALAEHPGVEVILIGGRLDKASMAVTGAAALAGVRAVRADLCVLGVCSLHPDIGITAVGFEEAQIKRALIDGAADVVAVATADKIGAASPFAVGPITGLTHLVTDHGVPESALTGLADLGIEVVRA